MSHAHRLNAAVEAGTVSEWVHDPSAFAHLGQASILIQNLRPKPESSAEQMASKQQAPPKSFHRTTAPVNSCAIHVRRCDPS